MILQFPVYAGFHRIHRSVKNKNAKGNKMPKFTDIDLSDWKNCDVVTDSLWLINARDNTGKHNGFYHGNFVPQIPNQLIKRYTKKGDIVFDPFVGSGTTVFEAENLERNYIGIDIQADLINYIIEKADNKNCISLIQGDSANINTFDNIKEILKKFGKESVQFAILHPPYSDIIKFSNIKEDLSNSKDIKEFRGKFEKVLINTIEILESSRYLAIVIGDKYENGEWIPLGSMIMSDAMHCGLKLKSIIVKNMCGNRAKQNKEGIWRYRALSSDYYIFKHEYIYIFKKESK
jgi:DNA modification methylase